MPVSTYSFSLALSLHFVTSCYVTEKHSLSNRDSNRSVEPRLNSYTLIQSSVVPKHPSDIQSIVCLNSTTVKGWHMATNNKPNDQKIIKNLTRRQFIKTTARGRPLSMSPHRSLLIEQDRRPRHKRVASVRHEKLIAPDQNVSAPHARQGVWTLPSWPLPEKAV